MKGMPRSAQIHRGSPRRYSCAYSRLSRLYLRSNSCCTRRGWGGREGPLAIGAQELQAAAAAGSSASVGKEV